MSLVDCILCDAMLVLIALAVVFDNNALMFGLMLTFASKVVLVVMFAVVLFVLVLLFLLLDALKLILTTLVVPVLVSIVSIGVSILAADEFSPMSISSGYSTMRPLSTLDSFRLTFALFPYIR